MALSQPAAPASAPTSEGTPRRASTALAAGGVLAALAASSCCVIPFALVMLGVSGAWIGNLTALTPYQPYFVALAVALIGGGFWLAYHRPAVACADGSYCARPTSNRMARVGLWAGAVIVVIGVAFPRPGAVVPGNLKEENHMKLAILTLAVVAAFMGAAPATAAERTVTLAVDNMYCNTCPAAVKKSLTRLAGVSNATVSYETKLATVIFDDAKTDVGALITATTNAGYPSRVAP